MGQQPNIELEIADLPRPRPAPAPARRWRPQRPGELTAPEEVPWGGAFGTTGPDTGYGLRLIRGRDIPLAPGEHRQNAQAAIASLAGARASFFGRAPTTEDVDVSMLILGYVRQGLPAELIDGLAADRVAWIAGLGHDATKARMLVAAVPVENLTGARDELQARMALGERLIAR